MHISVNKRGLTVTSVAGSVAEGEVTWVSYAIEVILLSIKERIHFSGNFIINLMWTTKEKIRVDTKDRM